MQLIYMYIKHFRNLIDLPVKFSPVHEVKYDFEKKTLFFQKKKDVVEIGPKLYGERVLSVHGIVGRNAVGKTNLSDLISLPIRYRKRHDSESQDSYFLLYCSEDGKLYLEVHDEADKKSEQLFSDLYPLFGDETEGLSKDSSCWHTGWIEIQKKNSSVKWTKQREVFPTQIVSLREKIRVENFLNIFKIKNEKVVEDSENHRYIGEYTYGSLAHQYQALFTIQKIADLAARENDPDNAPPFHDKKYELILHVAELYKNYLDCFPGMNTDLVAKAPAHMQYALYLLCEFITVTIFSSKNSVQFWKRSEASVKYVTAVEGTNFYSFVKEFLSDETYPQSKFIQYIKDQIPKRMKTILPDSYDKALQTFVKVIQDFFQITDRTETVHFLIRETTAELHVQPNQEKPDRSAKLIAFLENDLCMNTQYFRHFWHNISDGEEHLLEGYSSLHKLLSKVGVLENNSATPDTCILLLDEPELHSHPDLARNFIFWLTQWLNGVAVENTKTSYQIIILTHSPFLLSDIEKSYVLNLRRDHEDCVRIIHPEEQTFAANIYNILKDTIFLSQSVGGIAYKHLHNLIEDLNNPVSGSWNGTFIKKEDQELLISLIGEPILRESFRQAYTTLRPVKERNGEDRADNSTPDR